jgi:hypothetical protein
MINYSLKSIHDGGTFDDIELQENTLQLLLDDI